MFSIILEQYIDTINEIDNIFYSISLEADTTTVGTASLIDDDKNKINNGNDFFNRFKIILDKLLAIIERSILTIRHIYEKILLTDKGFKKELREAEVNRKPLNGIRLITYSYTPELLDGINSKFKKVVSDIVNNVKTKATDDDTTPLVMDKSDFVKYVFKQIGSPDNINDMDIYFKYIREKFRGQKLEKSIMASTIPQHIKVAEGYETLHLSSNRDLVFFKLKINELNSTLRVTSKNPDITDEEKRKLVRKMHNLAYIYNMYSSFCNINMELRIEQMLNSRIIIKKLYQL